MQLLLDSIILIEHSIKHCVWPGRVCVDKLQQIHSMLLILMLANNQVHRTLPSSSWDELFDTFGPLPLEVQPESNASLLGSKLPDDGGCMGAGGDLNRQPFPGRQVEYI